MIDAAKAEEIRAAIKEFRAWQDDDTRVEAYPAIDFADHAAEWLEELLADGD